MNSKDSVPQTTQIEIKGLQVWGHHGVLEEEQDWPQTFEIDVVLKVPRVERDDLIQTVDYREVINTIHHINQSQRFRLIEAFAHRVGQTLLNAFDLIEEVVVRIKKCPAFPVGIHLDHVSAEVHFKREARSGPTSA